MFFSAGTPGKDMYKLILASDARKNKSSASQYDANDCQDSSLFKAAEVQGKVLICSFGLGYLLGWSSMKNVIGTVKNLSAVGLVMVATDGIGEEFSVPNTPFPVPAIILTTINGTKVCFLNSRHFLSILDDQNLYISKVLDKFPL